MNIKRVLLFLLLFVFLTINVFGQAATSEKSAPKDVLSRQIELDLRDVTPREMFLYMMLQEGLIAGWVELDDKDVRRFNVNIELPLRSTMDYILSFDTRYRWVEDKGVVNLLPIEEPKILNVCISKFSAVKSNPQELVRELINTKEVKDAAKTIDVKFGGLYRFPNPHGGDEGSDEVEIENKEDCGDCSDTQNTEKFLIDTDNLTVRQILNELTRSNKRLRYWKYSEKHIIDSEGNEKIYFYITLA